MQWCLYHFYWAINPDTLKPKKLLWLGGQGLVFKNPWNYFLISKILLKETEGGLHYIQMQLAFKNDIKVEEEACSLEYLLLCFSMKTLS